MGPHVDWGETSNIYDGVVQVGVSPTPIIEIMIAGMREYAVCPNHHAMNDFMGNSSIHGTGELVSEAWGILRSMLYRSFNPEEAFELSRNRWANILDGQEAVNRLAREVGLSSWDKNRDLFMETAYKWWEKNPVELTARREDTTVSIPYATYTPDTPKIAYYEVETNNHWVVRTKDGVYVDHDQYRADLMSRYPGLMIKDGAPG